MSTNQPIENVGKKVFDLKDPEAKRALWAYVKEELHKVYSGHKYPTHHRDTSNPLWITAASVHHDAVDGAESIEDVLRTVPKNYQLITYSIQQFLEANGYPIPSSKDKKSEQQPTDISQLFVSVTEAVSDVLSVPVQVVQGAWVAARQKAKDRIEATTGTRPGTEVPDEEFLAALPEAHPLGAEIRYAILQRLKSRQ